MKDGPTPITVLSCRGCTFYHGISDIGGTCRNPTVIDQTMPRFAFEVWNQPGEMIMFVKLGVYRLKEDAEHTRDWIPVPSICCPFAEEKP